MKDWHLAKPSDIPGFDVAVFGDNVFRENLAAALRAKGYNVIEGVDKGPPGSLVVRCEFLAYESGGQYEKWIYPGGVIQKVKVRTTLIDQTTDAQLGELVTEGWDSWGVGGTKPIISAANELADTINSRIEAGP